MGESIKDRLSDIEHNIKQTKFYVLLLFNYQNTEFYYHANLFSEQNATSLLSFLFGLVSLLGLGVSMYALSTVKGEPSYLIMGLVIFLGACIGFILLLVKSIYSWFAEKSMKKVIDGQKIVRETITARLKSLAEELGIDLDDNTKAVP